MIAPEGWPFVLVFLCAAVAAGALGWLPVAVGLAACCGFCLFFFRDPRRECTLAADIACSPADGKVIACGAAPEGTAPSGLPLRVSVFMSVFSVHVNRAPIDATLADYRYNRGRTLAAYTDKASLVNERTCRSGKARRDASDSSRSPASSRAGSSSTTGPGTPFAGATGSG
jgi:phosphatidylserine decarboxylase